MKNFNLFDYLFIFFKDHGMAIIWIIIFYLLGRFVLDVIAKKIIRFVIRNTSLKKDDLEQRVKTIWSLILNIGNLLLFVVVILMILNVFGVDIKPILAGFGIVGIIIGLGAQSVVKDFIAGILMLFENQLNIGDSVQIGSLKGVVKKITFRSIVLQDNNKKIYYISNGSITSVVNFSQKKISK